MNHLRTIFASVLLATASTASLAGQEREGFSSTKGVFLSFEQGGLVAFDSQDKLVELVEHCEKGKRVFSHTRKREYRCKTSLLEGGEYSGFIRVEILGVTPQDEGEVPHVFTIEHARSTSWEIRTLLDQEVAAISDLVRSDRTRYGSLTERLRFTEAIAVKRPNAVLTTYFVPGEQIKDEDAFYEAQRHHVFVARKDAYRYQGKLLAKPTQYLDLDGDEIPEVVVEESCDGMCVSIWSLQRGPKRLGGLGGH